MHVESINGHLGQPNQPLPLLFLWMNTGCNARCPMCEIWRDRSKTRLTAAQVRDWASEWRQMGVQDLQLCGESTLHPELRDVCEILFANQINIHLLSNGLRMSQAADQIARYVKTVTVSLDGPPEIHDRIRGVPLAYERLKRGIARFREIIPDLPVHGRCVVHRDNFRHLQATVETAHELRLSSISFLGIDVTSSAFGRENLPREEWIGARKLALEEQEVPVIAADVERLIVNCASDFESGFIVETPEILRGVLISYYEALIGQGYYRPRTTRCNAPWTSAVIEPDGSVRPCFFLPAYGNMHDQGSFGNVINAPSARQFRQNLDTATHPICKHCICPRYNEIAEATEQSKA
jgi:Fe-coproporphyrin III synthase